MNYLNSKMKSVFVLFTFSSLISVIMAIDVVIKNPETLTNDFIGFLLPLILSVLLLSLFWFKREIGLRRRHYFIWVIPVLNVISFNHVPISTFVFMSIATLMIGLIIFINLYIGDGLDL